MFTMNRDKDEMSDSSNNNRFSRSQFAPSPPQWYLSVNDSESDSWEQAAVARISRPTGVGEDNSNMSGFSRSDSMKFLSSQNDQNSTDDTSRFELKKLTLDQYGTFMNDFDPEKSKREMRKMNRRIYSKESKKNQIYDDKGLLMESQLDLCDCLDKNCPGCHFPCQRCGSQKCGSDCRCNRKYMVELIEVEGTDTYYSFPPKENC